MKARIIFDVEPNTTYVLTVICWDQARNEAFDLARRMGRKHWTLKYDGFTLRV